MENAGRASGLNSRGLEGLRVEEEVKRPDPAGIFDWELKRKRERERAKAPVVQDFWVWREWGLANTWKDTMKLQRRSSNYFDIIRMGREGVEKLGFEGLMSGVQAVGIGACTQPRNQCFLRSFCGI